MILYDFSSLVHRSLHSAIKVVNPHKKEGKYVTEEFMPYTIHRILNEIVESYNQYYRTYKNLVITIDNHSVPYWRKSIYPAYKQQRVKEREESEVNFAEVYKHINLLTTVLQKYSAFKTISSPGAEADDIIGVLTRKFSPYEKILILSPDKDFKQLHKFGDIKQWSSLTNKWIVNDEPEGWELEHICIGDAVDNVPRVVDFSVFSDNFRNYYKGTELDFYKLSETEKNKILADYKILKPNGEPDIFNNPKFGPATLKKKIQEFGSLDNFLDSNPIYRLNYERNRRLVLDSEIPAKIEADIMSQYAAARTDFDISAMKKYLTHYGLATAVGWFEELNNKLATPVEMTPFNVDFNKLYI